MSDPQQNVPHDSPDERGAIPSPGISPMAVKRRAGGIWSSVWFALKAVEIRLRFIAVLVGIGLVIGYWDTIKNYWDRWTRPEAGAVTALDNSQEFYCPMHPSVVRDKPDPGGATPKCPICGMPLSKRNKGELSTLPEGIVSRVQLSPYRIQLAGITTAEAMLRPLTMDVKTVGYVAIDERGLSRIVVRASGYVEKLYVNESFAEVREGEPLAEIYSPELYSAAQELLIARGGHGSSLADIAREKLRLLGVADKEIDEIIRSGKASSRLVIRSPHGGHVFEKHIVEGDSIEAGHMLFEVADLSSVWIEGEVYEKDVAMLHRGQAIEATVEAFPGRVFKGRIGLVHPHVETSSRTVRVRFELENPGHMLRPGMFATVSLKTPMQEIEPFRSLEQSQRADHVAMNDAGEGSEATADNAAHADHNHPPSDDSLIAMQKTCPVTGAKLGSMGQPVKATAAGRTLFLCCAGCQDKLAADPDYYLDRMTTVSDAGVLAVPELSVIDTGNMKVVYIEREPGLFEGVAVTLGPLSAGYYPVIDGLLPGDRVAAAGAFLVDAETRLNPAAASAYFGASGTPSSSAAPTSHQHGSPPEAASPGASPSGDAPNEVRDNLTKLPEADRALAERQAKCPITNMPLGSMGVPFKMIVEGTPLFLCCEGCKGQVDKDPKAALTKIGHDASTR